MQYLVHCDGDNEKRKRLERFCTIKQHLPMIDAYIVEIEADRPQAVEQMLSGYEIEKDSRIYAQMNRVNEIIDVGYAHQRGILGTGIGVAVVDTGISPHKDFTDTRNRIVAFKDMINGKTEAYDDNGHGTHVSGIVGGSGFSSKQKYMGVAPDCNLISVKVLDDKGDGNTSDVLSGLQWIIDHKEEYNIRIVNISVGTTKKERVDENSLLVKGVNAVWDSGIVVVVAAGNNGPGPMSISIPGISRKVITVGCADDNVAVELGGSRVRDYSGRGPTSACIKKPDIVAPGSNIVSCNISSPLLGWQKHLQNNCSPMLYTVKSGTSMATPVVSGALALLLQKYPNMTNTEVKLKLRQTAVDLGYHWEKQGWGLIYIPSLLS